MFPSKNQSSRAKTRQSQDLEQYWRTGKKSQGYEDSDAAAAPDDQSGSDGPMPADDPSVNYMGPEFGPFECGACVYFIADGQPCQKVADPVQSEGICKLFQSAGNESQDQEHAEGSAPSAADANSEGLM